jgi:hypothetical protein
MDYSNLKDIEVMLANFKRQEWPYDYKFDLISFNGFSIHMCAGPGYYSLPNDYIECIVDYTAVQVHITEGDLLIRPLDDSRFAKFSWSKYFTPNYHAIKTGCGERVPINVLCEIIRDVNRISKLKAFI